jgi:hypothetical protein
MKTGFDNSDTSYNGDYQTTIPAKFGSYWLSSVREEFLDQVIDSSSS